MSHEIVVVTSCTATKEYTPDGKHRTAESLYLGQQHVRLMRGVQSYRDADEPAGDLRLRILSAFHGLIKPETRIASYDHTFSGQPVDVVRSHAAEKGVPAAIRSELARDFSVAILLLGDPYLRACDLDETVKLGGPVISFCSPAAARRMPKLDRLTTIELSNEHAKRFSCGLIALKGELVGRMLGQLADEPDELENLIVYKPRDILSWLKRTPSAADRLAA